MQSLILSTYLFLVVSLVYAFETGTRLTALKLQKQKQSNDGYALSNLHHHSTNAQKFVSLNKRGNTRLYFQGSPDSSNDGNDNEDDDSDNEGDDGQSNTLDDGIPIGVRNAVEVISNNPLTRIFTNTYSFFWNLPRQNMPYDAPWVLFKNSSAQFISWYQFPHNLPPYRYVGEDQRDDMFCYGMPGNTLPLGNWDPFGFQLVSEKVLYKYRESELKHGRLAMLATIAFPVQEIYHPIHKEIGGMAITHMSQLRHLEFSDCIISTEKFVQILSGVGMKDLSHMFSTFLFVGQEGASDAVSIVTELEQNSNIDFSILGIHPEVNADYLFLILILMSVEIHAFKRNWTRWLSDEYNHQFDHNIGIGNLNRSYKNGDYGFDPLGFYPRTKREKRFMIEKELNHGRLAMVAFIVMMGQEYFTGVPISKSILDFFYGGGDAVTSTTLDMLKPFGSLPAFINERIATSGFNAAAMR